ncbi:MAG: hypothetical protein IPJ71_02125 [Bdellovibrionales bacterium]|nr:hypothetical protein [Bdellovibrionales bacterium]
MKCLVLVLSVMFSVSFAFAELETVKGAKQDIKALKNEMLVKLNDVEKEIEELRAKVKEKGNQTLEETIKELEEKRTGIRAEVDSLKQDASTNLKTLRKKLGDALDSLHAKAKKALQQD